MVGEGLFALPCDLRNAPENISNVLDGIGIIAKNKCLDDFYK